MHEVFIDRDNKLADRKGIMDYGILRSMFIRRLSLLGRLG